MEMISLNIWSLSCGVIRALHIAVVQFPFWTFRSIGFGGRWALLRFGRIKIIFARDANQSKQGVTPGVCELLPV